MLRGNCSISHGRNVRLITEGHDVFVFVVLPFQELYDGGFVIEGRIVSRSVELLDVVGLEADHVFIALKNVLKGTPFVEMCSLLFLAGERNLAEDDITSVPSLGIKHVESVPLVLHADVHHFRVLLVENSLVAVVNPESVGGLEL